MTLRLLERLRLHAVDRPGAIAIVQADAPGWRPLTWKELHADVGALAGHLRQVIADGGTLLLCCPNQAEYIVAYLAIVSTGAAVFPISPELTVVEIATAAERSGAAGILAPSALLQLLDKSNLDALLRIPLDDVIRSALGAQRPSRMGSSAAAMLLQSSGTTGQPKIVRRGAAALDAVSEAMVEAVGFRPSDHVLACVPLCHSYGVEHGLLAPIFAGSCIHLCRGFELSVVQRALSQEQITLFPAVPFMLEMLCQLVDDVPATKLHKVYSAGGRLPATVAEVIQHRFDIRIGQVYGATEIGSVTFNDPSSAEFDPTTVGLPMRGVSIRILDDAMTPQLPGTDGHVAIAADSMLSEYVGGEAVHLQDGHFLTGDLGRVNESGALTITGRTKLLIDVGGLKVNPLEVEEVLARHPKIAECVVVPIEITQTVSRLKAIVVVREGEVSEAELRQFARQNLASYKVPRVFEMRPSLPRSAAGKVLRHLL
ncbi:MAG TPA: class I adenylate-forming enzyme family protein [Tepidisphaeraceae bacterium]